MMADLNNIEEGNTARLAALLGAQLNERIQQVVERERAATTLELEQFVKQTGTLKISFPRNRVKIEIRDEDDDEATLMNECALEANGVNAPLNANGFHEIRMSEIRSLDVVKKLLVESLSKKTCTNIQVASFILAALNISDGKPFKIPLFFNELLLLSIPATIWWNKNHGIIRYFNHFKSYSRVYVIACFIASLALAFAVEACIFVYIEKPFDMLFPVMACRLSYVTFAVIYSYSRYLSQMMEVCALLKTKVIILTQDGTTENKLVFVPNGGIQALVDRLPVYRLASSAISKYLIPLAVHFTFGCILYALDLQGVSNDCYALLAVNNMFEFYFFLVFGLVLNLLTASFEQTVGKNAELKLGLRIAEYNIDSKFLMSLLVPIMTYILTHQ